MKIFLAGKMDRDGGAWRDAIVGTHWSARVMDTVPRWCLYDQGTFGAGENGYVDEYGSAEPPPPPWPTVPNDWVLDLHEFVGPFRSVYPKVESKYSGMAHGQEWIGSHGEMFSHHKRHIINQCRQAIERSDLVFAYINSVDCYGTLAEIGIAHALGKYIHVEVQPDACWEGDDYWYLESLANTATNLHFYYDNRRMMTPVEALRDALVRWTARKDKPPVLQVVPASMDRRKEQAYIREIVTYGEAFRQISQWTSDPRVRDEAGRVLTRIQQVIGQ